MKALYIFFFFLSIFFVGLNPRSNAQKFDGLKFVTPSGAHLKVGDTLQLGKAQMGKHYRYVTYKYVGMPSPMIKKRGPASMDNEGSVLFVERISAKDGLIILKGIPYYKFECMAVDAFKSGELKTFSSL